MRMRGRASWLMKAFLCVGAATFCSGQTQPGGTTSQEPISLGAELRNSAGKEIHIFYIHGIGSYGPNDRDSLALRKNLCNYLKDCTSPAGTQMGSWDYANGDDFSLSAVVPKLEYLDEQIWKNEEEWHAAAPYSVHFQLARANGPAIYVDEL